MAEAQVSTLSTIKTPPNSNEAEQSLLGALMLKAEAWDQVADQVDESDFYRENHRLIYRAISDLASEGEPFDAITVTEWFARHGKLDRVDSGAYLTMLANETPGPANINGYAQIVREKSILRQLIAVGTDIADTALGTSGRSSLEVLEEAEQRIYAIAEQGSRRTSQYVRVRDVMADAMELLHELQQGEGKMTGVPTGFTELDERTSGLQNSDLIIVAG
ncbi:MAG TPA: DnaB-like helicase N-terminal domain-containing protein, partial [Wenzhouxiangella sp.]|nr:DnaB-like helicase N-terminal domain-containing protein [Wenzhouxiangella sp.]